MRTRLVTRRRFLITLTSAIFLQWYSGLTVAKQTLNMLLAQEYQADVELKHYLVSEKFDGVRAVWDGEKFYTRKGNVIAAPDWFTKKLPATFLDGELWLARGKFDVLSGIVRKELPIDAEWRDVSYLVFELPNAPGTFQQRAERIVKIVKQANISHLKAVKQFRVKDQAELNQRLKQVVAAGGEGLMLHRLDSHYVSGRSAALLKLKLQYDAEATVVAHTAGRGKYKGKLGALVVQTPKGLRFKLGTGFSDAQRANPPKIGSIVTYTYRGKTPNGKPKFASFLRIRDE